MSGHETERTGGRRVAYGVSRFPTTTETFVVREMNALVDGFPDVEIELFSLFPAATEFLHPSAERWMAGLQRPTVAEAAVASLWWSARRPVELARAVGTIVRAAWRSPASLAKSLATLPLAAAHARRLRVDSERVDHVHVHFASYPTLAAWLIRRLTGIPYSFTAHAYDIFIDQALLAEKVAEAEFVVTISEFNRSLLRRFGGDDVTPVHVVHCGISPETYAFRARAIPSEGPIRAICVAALEEKKGHEVLFSALAGASGELERLEVDLVGDGPLRGELESRVAALSLGGRVRFHGSQPESRVRQMLDEADLFVLPSKVSSTGQMEGLPVSLIEALAAGLIAVSTNLSGIPELIRDGDTGYLAEADDPESLAAALTRAITSDQVDPARGRALVESEFDLADSAAAMHDLLAREGTGAKDRPSSG